MTQHAIPDRARRAVRIWLMLVAAIVAALVIVGGATRLTGSGLSIVEWKPLVGVVPPLDQHGWQTEFEKYKTIPQFKQLNRDMTLAQFQKIYWWEWVHRLLARAVGLVFVVPLLWFLWRGHIERGVGRRLWGIFALGALQGVVGWWMVYSGLSERVSVSQYRLAVHLTLAAAIFAAIIHCAEQLAPRADIRAPLRLRLGAGAIVGIVLLQIYLGALVAGLHAGLVYNTWPAIDGAMWPDMARLFFEQPAWRNFFDNALLVQFNHRLVAYALWIAVIVHAGDVVAMLRRGGVVTRALALASVATIQAALGIAALLHQVPIALALAHQAGAVVVLAIAVVHAARLAEPACHGRRQGVDAATAVSTPPAPAQGRR
ncbi:MAG: COX15/CtaA family protein [Proteobacteria bacterium]|nr:COX15/CtaA family protein [Pseudomonadota bacterium]